MWMKRSCGVVRSVKLLPPTGLLAVRANDVRRRLLAATILLAALAISQLRAQEPERVLSPVEAKELTLDQLMNARIYSVSKKPEKLSTAASAITVITEEDIRRSGVNNIPD